MLFSGYDNQNDISNRLGMPVDVVADTAYLNSISGETLQLYYWSTNVLTVDAGEAAGTVVIAKFAYSGILDSLGGMIGNSKDTSVVFTTGTVLTTEVACDYSQIGAPDNATLEQIATDLTANMSNGEYCIDYRNGILYGLKATTGTSDTVAYKVSTQTTGGGTSIAATVKVTDGTDVLDVLVQDAAFGTASKGLGVFGKYQATPTTYTDGDAAPILLDANGRIVLSSDIEIGAVEIKDGTTDARQAVKVDNATASATPTVALVGAHYKATADTYDDNDASPLHVDANGNLKTTASPDIPTTITSGTKSVASAGTAEALAASASAKAVIIQAHIDNTGYIYVGSSSVDSTNGIVLTAGDSVTLEISDISTVYIDASVSTDGVYFQRLS